MRTVIQRVLEASITIDGEVRASIEKGLLCLIGINKHDTPQDIQKLIAKILKLRIFEDEHGKMNVNIKDAGGEILLVSQFTLYGDCTKGNRPSFIEAMPPAHAVSLYDQCVEQFKIAYPQTKSGAFQADMQVKLINDGPVTLVFDV